jgi:hypothetical protein
MPTGFYPEIPDENQLSFKYYQHVKTPLDKSGCRIIAKLDGLIMP